MNIDITKNPHGKHIKKYVVECSKQLDRRTRNSYSRVFIEHLDGSFFKFSRAVLFLPHFITTKEKDPETMDSFAFVFSTSLSPVMFFREDLRDVFESTINIYDKQLGPRLLSVNISRFYANHFDYKDLNHTLFIQTGLVSFYLTHAKHIVLHGNLIAITEHNGCFRFPMKNIKHFSSGHM